MMGFEFNFEAAIRAEYSVVLIHRVHTAFRAGDARFRVKVCLHFSF